MNVVVYFLCLVLLLPMAGFAAFGFFIDSLTQFGFWEVFKFIFSPLYDPFGRGIWLLLSLASGLAICVAGFFPESRTYGFAIIAVAGVLCAAYVAKAYPGAWTPAALVLVIPSAASVSISVYSLVRSLR